MDVPDWLAGVTVEQVIGLILVLAAASVAARKLWRGSRKLGALVDDLLGTPARPGVEARPGLMERVAAVEATTSDTAAQLATTADQVRTVHYQVLPNGGESLRDEVTRNTEGIKTAHDKIDELDVRLTAIERRQPPPE